MTYTHALILGIVQGLTEFLPVSSSGHLVLAQQFFGMSENMVNFDIFLHFGTLLAVLVVFRKSIIKLLSGCFKNGYSSITGKTSFAEMYTHSEDFRLLTALIIGTIPAVLVGFTMKDSIERLFTSTIPVLIALFFTGIVLIATFFSKRGEKHFGLPEGFAVGIAQALAIIPGISRSGTTISAALFCGIKRQEAGEFSFLLSIPVIIGATILAVMDTAEPGGFTIVLGPYITGAVAAFCSGWLSLVMLMRVVKRGKLGYFGFYCLIVALGGGVIYMTQCFFR